MSNETKITPLRQRMIEDMQMRKFTHHTQSDYLRGIKKLSAFIGKSPDSLLEIIIIV